MYQQLTPNLYLVHNADEFEALQDRLLKTELNLPERPANYVPDELELLYPHWIKLIADYPLLVTLEGSISTMRMVPVGKVIGRMGTINQLDMRPAFNKLKEACVNCAPLKQPRILLTGITIKARTAAVRRGNEVRTTHNSDLTEAMAKLGMNLTQLKTLRIQFGDGRFHGSIEMKEEMMFVSQVRDITNHIAHVTMDEKTGKFTADYIFNHYDFMNAMPELREYRDLAKWEISVTTAVESSLDSSKKN